MSAHPFLGVGRTPEIIGTSGDGDLVVQGWAVWYGGLDRTMENFSTGALRDAIEQTRIRPYGLPLCFNHLKAAVLGRVDSLEERPEGVWMKATVFAQDATSPLRFLYDMVKRGGLKGLSVGGFFDRVGNKIVHADLTEISIASIPTHAMAGIVTTEGKSAELAAAFGNLREWHDEDSMEWARRRMRERRQASALAASLRGLAADLSTLTRR